MKAKAEACPRCSGDASMPDNEPGASTRVIEKLHLREGRPRWTMIVASEKERVRMRGRVRERARERERATRESDARGTRENESETHQYRETKRDCGT